jgi:hypothetical protein
MKNYLSLINKAINREPIGVFEKHHILPKSLKNVQLAKELLLDPFGDIELNKKIKLTLREHFLAHHLLVKIFEKINKNCFYRMAFAASMLNSRCGNSKKYEWFRKIFCKANSEFYTGKPSRAKGKKWSEEAKLNKSKNHYMRGKTYEDAYGKEVADKIIKERKNLRKGKTYKEIYGEEKGKEIINKLSNRTFSDEHKKNISLSKKGIKISEETKQKISIFFKNDCLNPNIDQTLYEFINKNTNEIICARKIDMKKKYKCNTIHRVVRDKTKSCKGWMFTGNIKQKEEING